MCAAVAETERPCENLERRLFCPLPQSRVLPSLPCAAAATCYCCCGKDEKGKEEEKAATSSSSAPNPGSSLGPRGRGRNPRRGRHELPFDADATPCAPSPTWRGEKKAATSSSSAPDPGYSSAPAAAGTSPTRPPRAPVRRRRPAPSPTWRDVHKAAADIKVDVPATVESLRWEEVARVMSYMDAVVKVFCMHTEPNFSMPWQRKRKYTYFGGRRRGGLVGRSWWSLAPVRRPRLIVASARGGGRTSGGTQIRRPPSACQFVIVCFLREVIDNQRYMVSAGPEY